MATRTTGAATPTCRDEAPCYLVEWYHPSLAGEPVERTARRVGDAARTMSTGDERIELLLTLYMPGDEVAFCLLAAPSADAVERVSRHAQLTDHRITQARVSTPIRDNQEMT